MKNQIYVILFILLFVGCNKNIVNITPKEIEKNDLSGSIILEGTKLTYTVKGKGIPFLVIGSDAEFFSKELQNKFRMYFIDIRGTAKEYTPINPEQYTIETLIQDIDTLRSVLGLEKFIIGGHSILGVVSYKYAQAHPEYVSHVVMIGTPRLFGTKEFFDSTTSYWNNAPEERRLLFEEKQNQFKEQIDELTPRQTFVKGVVAEGPKRWHNANFDATESMNRVSFNIDYVRHMFVNLFPSFNLCAPEEELNVPIFVATGKSDYISPPTLWEGPCKDISNFTISLFEKSGHTPHFEESQLFNERLIDWIEEN